MLANKHIPLYRPYLPSFKKYSHYLEKMYANKWLTNNGPLVQEFSLKLASYLNVPYLVLSCNGTSALQLAYHVFGLKGSVVSTPYSFVATCNSIDWVGLKAHFADIDPETLNLSPNNLINAMDANTSAIVPVHTYGNPCDFQGIEAIAQKAKVKVIYDAAHAFGIKIGNKSIFEFGDASAISLHATKLFHSIEGGALILKTKRDYEAAKRMINFGINIEEQTIASSGFNGKMSEAHAAMCLAMLDDIDMIIEKRVSLFNLYEYLLEDIVELPKRHLSATKNGAYFPILLKNSEQRKLVAESLAEQYIQSRSYFSPSLNTLEQFRNKRTFDCPISESVVGRVLCLPLYYDLHESDVKKVCSVVVNAIGPKASKYSQKYILQQGHV